MSSISGLLKTRVIMCMVASVVAISALTTFKELYHSGNFCTTDTEGFASVEILEILLQKGLNSDIIIP